MSVSGDSGWLAPSLLVLPLQAVAASLSVRIFARRVAPNIARLHEPASAIDSLGPFALALPLIVSGWRGGWSASGAIWIAVGAPAMIALMAMGAAIVVGGMSAQRLRVSPVHALAWSAVGGLLLMLGAAHDLTVWTGQCAFAVGAVLLWMNTPDLPRGQPDAIESQVGGGLTLILLCAIVQAVALAIVPMRFLPIAAAITLAHAGMVVAATSRGCAPAAALRMGGWTAAYGALLGLGAVSLRQLFPIAASMGFGHSEPPPMKVAHGFGALALEATLLLLMGGAALIIERAVFARTVRFALGGVVITGAAMLAAARLASL